MTSAASPQASSHGVIAVLQALVAQLVAMMRGIGSRREVERQLVSCEIQLVMALYGGGLFEDPDFLEAPANVQRSWVRRLCRDLAEVRCLRTKLQRLRTINGHGYRRNPPTMVALRFERRIAARRTRRLGCSRRAFVASTREPLAGTPPRTSDIASCSTRNRHSGAASPCLNPDKTGLFQAN